MRIRGRIKAPTFLAIDEITLASVSVPAIGAARLHPAEGLLRLAAPPGLEVDQAAPPIASNERDGPDLPREVSPTPQGLIAKLAPTALMRIKA
ncbi:MAG TPA: hypothetical protein VFA50_00965 [Stellaceae bacterium]|nr:hypothetical protein [Stellaceae bacterium]